jgi:hypothetical protein
LSGATNNFAQVFGYLTLSNKINLAIGKSMALNCQFSLQNVSGNGSVFRFGLFDSAAVDPRIAAGGSAGNFAGTRGFAANLTAQNEGATVNLQRRSGTSASSSLIGNLNAYRNSLGSLNPFSLYSLKIEAK